MKGFEVPSDACLVALYEGVIDIPILGNISGLVKQDSTVFIRWADQQKAPLKQLKDWQGLLRALRGTGQDIACACMGGHGRTGTFLAVMSWLMELPQKEDKKPIQYIRDIYCKEAVESLVQHEQIRDMTGVDETNLYVKAEKWYGGAYNWETHYGNKVDNLDKSSNKPFALEHDPESDVQLYGWFDAKLSSGEFCKLTGYPANEGFWERDNVGWYWVWKEGEKEEYYKSETSTATNVESEYDEVINASSITVSGLHDT